MPTPIREPSLNPSRVNLVYIISYSYRVISVIYLINFEQNVKFAETVKSYAITRNLHLQPKTIQPP